MLTPRVGLMNRDYRFSWVRDTSFSLYALIRLGFTEEANAYVDFILARLKDRNSDGSLQIVYTIHGGKVSSRQQDANTEPCRTLTRSSSTISKATKAQNPSESAMAQQIIFSSTSTASSWIVFISLRNTQSPWLGTLGYLSVRVSVFDCRDSISMLMMATVIDYVYVKTRL